MASVVNKLHQVSKRFIQKSYSRQSEALASLLISQKSAENFDSFVQKYGAITDINHGYEIQNEMCSILESQHGFIKQGYKIGCTAPNIQAMFGINKPFCGPFYHKWIQNDISKTLSKEKQLTLGIEAEWIFKIGDTLNINNKTDIELTDIYPLIECAYPGYELIDLRILKDNIFSTPIQYLISDLAWTGGVVIGKQSTIKDLGYNSWKEYDEHKLRESKVIAYVGDNITNMKEVGIGYGKQILESPFNSIQFLYQHLLKQGKTVENGSLIATGTATGLNILEQNQIGKAVFDDLGTVQFQLV
eukprot:306415_1